MNRGVYLALLLFAATVLTIWAFGLILLPFLIPIAWAMCLATVTGGLHVRLLRATHRDALSAFLMTIATCVLVLVPVTVVGGSIVKEAIALSTRVQSERADRAAPPVEHPPAPAPTPAPSAASDDGWDRFFAKHPRLDDVRKDADRALASFGTNTKAMKDEVLARVAQPVTSGTLGVLQAIFGIGFGFLVMLATLFFLYRDGDKIRKLVVDLAPLTPKETGRILDTLRETAFAAIVGGLATAMLQGLLGGIAFAIVGISSPVFWGFVMALLSLLPVGGSAFAWGPTGIYFLMSGDTFRGVFLLSWGVVLMGATDSVLRPWLMRRAGASAIHPLLLFFGILSGIGLFGVSGIVFGPLLVAFVLVVVSIYREHFGKKTDPGAMDVAPAAVPASPDRRSGSPDLLSGS